MSKIAALLHPTSRQGSGVESQQQDIAAELLQAAAQASVEHDSSGESADEVAEGSPVDGQKLEKRKKRSRACQSCRTMKIRCNPVEGQDACLACSKVNRSCVMPGPSRKRQKTVHKVAELEKKINALTQSLLSKTQVDPTPQPSPVVTDASRSATERNKASPDLSNSCSLFPKQDDTWLPPAHKSAVSSYEDVIDRGIISFPVAELVFDRFIADMNPLCPLVAFPPGTKVESVRRSRPLLFTACLAAGCNTLGPEIQSQIVTELARQLAHRIFFLFERSLDLIQALLVHTTWVGKHKEAKDMGFNMYIHSAVVMAHDLGLAKRLKTPLSQDPVEQAELRRTWLACYWCATCVAITLRHQTMVRWSNHLEECMDFFAKSPAALLTDHSLCSMVTVTHILEDVASSFHMDDPSSTVRLQDNSTQYSLRVFEKRISDWRREATTCLRPSILNIIEGTASLYTHEIALHSNHNVDDFRPPSGIPDSIEAGPVEDFITPYHLDAIVKCVGSMKLALDTFLVEFPSPQIWQLPCLAMVWTVYAVVAMIRLDGALRASKSKYAEIFLPDLKIDYYLDSIISRFADSVRINPSQTSAPVPVFLQAFQKLKVWHAFRSAGPVQVPAEYQGLMDPKHGMFTFTNKLEQMPQPKVSAPNMNTTSNTTANTTANTTVAPTEAATGMFSLTPAQTQKMHQSRERQSATSTAASIDVNRFDTQGGSWLTNSTMPIEASMFENQDWSFTMEDWNNFETNMVRPAGGAWLGYLL